MKIIIIRHYGLAFHSNKNAKLVATGIIHHIVLLK